MIRTFRDGMSRGIAGQPGGLARQVLIIVFVLIAVIVLSTISIWPTRISSHSSIAGLPPGRYFPAADHHPTGCSNLRATAQVGEGVGATIQLAAGICWNRTRVWWVWGLNRGDCVFSQILTEVQLTCRRSLAPHGPLHVSYRAQMTPWLLPFVHQTVTLNLTVLPGGTVIQFP